MSRHFVWMFGFLAACASSVTQDGPQDPSNIPDAAADAQPPADAGPQVVGKACSSDSDCGSDVFCHPIPVGGYCSFYCQSDADCPSGTVCSPAPYTRVTGLCMTKCTTNADCREGHGCAMLSLFSGPGGPKSSSPVCWAPQDGGP